MALSVNDPAAKFSRRFPTVKSQLFTTVRSVGNDPGQGINGSLFFTGDSTGAADVPETISFGAEEVVFSCACDRASSRHGKNPQTSRRDFRTCMRPNLNGLFPDFRRKLHSNYARRLFQRRVIPNK